MQSKRRSLYESLANTFSGTVLNLIATQIIMHGMGYQITLSENLLITVVMTVISIGRGYIIRRIFNRIA